MPTFANHTYSIVITIYLFIHLSLQLAASIYRDVKTFKTHILKHTRRVQGSAEFQDVKSYHHASETLCFFVGMACICMRVFVFGVSGHVAVRIGYVLLESSSRSHGFANE